MAQAPSKEIEHGSRRLYYLDNFRTYLTVLVIYHHTAVAYGGTGSWFYKSPHHPEASSPALVAFNALNQTYFMASFFFLSGFMSTRALQRKSVPTFLVTKYIKLGIPLATYTALAHPAQVALSRLHNHEPVSFNILTDFWASLRGVRGPVWYTALLLVFDTANALAPRMLSIAAPQFLAVMALDVAVTFVVRIYYPVGYTFVTFNLQLGYVVQYIISYGIGIRFSSFDASSVQPSVASTSHHIPLPGITVTTRMTIVAASIVSGGLIVGLLLAFPSIHTLREIQGGPNLAAISYAAWNETTGYLMGSGLLATFNRSTLLSRSWGAVGRYSYAAFLVHPIVLVGAQLWTDHFNGSGVLKTIIVGTASTVGSWVVGWGLVAIPGIGNLLV